ncbi:hypothetical protein GCM10027446_33410 [Angustibacter peucedani]
MTTPDDGLRAELLARFEADQQAPDLVYRTADDHRAAFDATQPPSTTPWPFAVLEWQPETAAPPSVQAALARVRSNTTWLVALVHERGWPGRDLVGEDGADAAWLLLQHAGAGVSTLDSPANRAFRRHCVPLLEAAVRAGQAHPRHLAHTVDGIAAVEGAPPRYGVLGQHVEVADGGARLVADVDLDQLARDRAVIGLAPLAEDLARRARGEDVPAVGSGTLEPWCALPD